MMNYCFTVKHDKGSSKIALVASDLATATKKLCASEKCPERAITNVAISDLLKTLYAVRVPEPFNLFRTELYDENDNLVATYGVHMDQPRKSKKTIVHNYWTYRLVFKN